MMRAPHWITCVWFCVLLSAICSTNACTSSLSHYGGFPILEVTDCSSHYDFGVATGAAFKDMIKIRVSESSAVRKINEFLQNSTLAAIYHNFTALNEQQYPQCWEEMEGMADGAGVTLDDIIQLNLRQELLTAMEEASAPREDACSDVLLPRPVEVEGRQAAAVGHNEDMSNDTLGHVGFIKATLGGHSWFVFVYAGELPSTAFGFSSSSQFAFTLNAVFPLRLRLPGVGRNMLSRSLLQMDNLEQALEVIKEPLGASGHSYNLLDLRTGRVLNVETGPGGMANAQEVKSGWYFHANSYLHLELPQRRDNSSIHRQAAAAQYAAPRNTSDILYLLGDTSDKEYPIYRQGDAGSSVYTLCTALFDLSSSRMIVYKGNPRDGDAVFAADFNTMEVTPYPEDAPRATEGRWWNNDRTESSSQEVKASLRGTAGWGASLWSMLEKVL